MKRIGYLSIMFLIVLMTSFLSVNAELDQEMRIYLDAQNQKTIAQINAKIDNAITSTESGMKKEFVSSTNYLEEQITKEYKQSIIALIFSIMGANLVILAIFKIIDIKLNRTRIVEKYEKDLEQSIQKNNEYRKELDFYRQSLIKYIEDFERNQGIKPNVEIKQEKVKKKIDWYLILGITLIVLSVIGAIIYFVYVPTSTSNITGI